MDGWMYEWMYGWIDGWMDERWIGIFFVQNIWGVWGLYNQMKLRTRDVVLNKEVGEASQVSQRSSLIS